MLKFSVLLEDRVDFVKKQNPHIDSTHDHFATARKGPDIVQYFADHADPTPKKHYTQWIINRYKTRDFRQEDAERVNAALTSFHKNKQHMPKEGRDIGHYGSLSQLEDALPKEDIKSKKEEKREVKHEGADVVHSEPGLSVHKLKTHAAAQFYGANTKWCTAGKNSNMFDHYNKQGPLYVVQAHSSGSLWKAVDDRDPVYKPTTAHTSKEEAESHVNANYGGKGRVEPPPVKTDKYQFHFPTHQFMNDQDRQANIPELIAKHPELKNVKDFKQSTRFLTDDELKNVDPTTIKNEGERADLAQRDPKMATQLVNDKSTRVRIAAAKHPEVAKLMTGEKSTEVGMHVAEHAGLARDILKNSPLAPVRARAIMRNALDPETSDSLESMGVSPSKNALTAADLKAHANDPSPMVRNAIGQKAPKLVHPIHQEKLYNFLPPNDSWGKHGDDSQGYDPNTHTNPGSGYNGHIKDDMHFDETLLSRRKQLAQKHPEEFVKDPDSGVRGFVARNPKLASQLKDDSNSQVRQTVAGHKELAATMLKDKSPEVRTRIASKHPDLAHHFLSDPNKDVRFQAMISTGSDLSTVRSKRHRIIAAQHGGVTAEKLKNDKDPGVRMNARAALGDVEHLQQNHDHYKNLKKALGPANWHDTGGEMSGGNDSFVRYKWNVGTGQVGGQYPGNGGHASVALRRRNTAIHTDLKATLDKIPGEIKKHPGFSVLKTNGNMHKIQFDAPRASLLKHAQLQRGGPTLEECWLIATNVTSQRQRFSH